jgi:hypothetical protein
MNLKTLILVSIASFAADALQPVTSLTSRSRLIRCHSESGKGFGKVTPPPSSKKSSEAGSLIELDKDVGLPSDTSSGRAGNEREKEFFLCHL